MPFVVLVRLNAADLRELAVRPTGYFQSHDERFISRARGIGITLNGLYR